MGVFLMILLVLLSVFMILLVLVQRGRGGGLAGALGGAGGQSAFGAKAGDTFTRITVVTAAIWIMLCIVAVKTLGGGSSFNQSGTTTQPDTGVGQQPGTADPSGDTAGTDGSSSVDE